MCFMKLATWKYESPVSSQSIASIPTTLNNEPMWYDVTRWPGIGGSVNSVAEVRALQRYPSWHKHFDKIRCHSRQTIPVIQIYTPIDCSQATTCSSDSTDTHGATHHRLIAGTQRDRMCDNTRNFYVVVQRANRKLSFQNFLTFVAKEGTKRMITNNTNNTYMSTCTELMMIDLPSHCFSKLYRGGAIPLTMTQHCWHDLVRSLDDYVDLQVYPMTA